MWIFSIQFFFKYENFKLKKIFLDLKMSIYFFMKYV